MNEGQLFINNDPLPDEPPPPISVKLTQVVTKLCTVLHYRLEVQPAYVEQSGSSSFLAAAKFNDQKTEKRLDFPLMTYWPVDL